MAPLMQVLLVLVLTLIPLMAAAEVGLQVGRRRRTDSDSEGRNQISMVEGALLGLLALLLGFTFSMAVDRFDSRGEMVVEEANALGTVAMRAEFLPDGLQGGFKARLREYGQARLRYAEAGNDHEKLRKAEEAARGLQDELWATVRDEGRARPTSMLALLADALGDLFDFREKRTSALDNTVPSSVWIVLYSVAILTSGSLGLGSGLTGKRILLSISLVPLLLAGILTLLVDLDHPRRGVIQVSQDSMIRAVGSLK